MTADRNEVRRQQNGEPQACGVPLSGEAEPSGQGF